MKKPIIALLCLLLVLLSGCFGDIRVQVPSDADVIYEESSAEVTSVSSEQESVFFSLPQIPSTEVLPPSSAASRRSPAENYTDSTSSEGTIIRNPDADKWERIYRSKFASDPSLCFAFWDIDRNGIPEIFVTDDYNPHRPNPTHQKLYTVRNGQLLFVGELNVRWFCFIEIEKGIVYYPQGEDKEFASFAYRYNGTKLTPLSDFIETYYDDDGLYMYRLGDKHYVRDKDTMPPIPYEIERMSFYDFDISIEGWEYFSNQKGIIWQR